MQPDKNKETNPREAGDDALSHLDEQPATGTSPAEDVGYSNEERVSEDAEAPNMPEDNDDPSGTGIASKE
jgi:hypothetical protein